ncbi:MULTISPECIES: DUF2147 domain-containing protein [unclassified Polaribacter]|jgi:uncharacterized protein (DUF2147 family)|uniref:DUF2147 domain-containing protein n=1 Tax=unclassified Polaribacter TaxID=196858 RepID=UPI001C4F7E08|nr:MULTISPECIES: DUF2147 domain-containing protein [unclassified Polaribacter]QXP64934.1 DUF2147 domain-containing protein [Polaribacter sp. HaHaR_3_91]QXP67429.1 DUF2147 domain-containing protein [Polaribacter sp. AHE13PA]QXP69582.1 DUF2147 domain-containing protein [Polaribacter sp. R2A056_3_33]
MKKSLFTFVLLIISFSMSSQTIFGKWNSKNDETGKVDSVVEIYEKNGKAFAKIIDIKNPDRKTAVCSLCEGENKDKPILGLNILSGLEKDGNEWSGGTILDPRNGKVYKSYVELVKPNKLKVRGYIGLSLFGKTTYWERAI